MTFLVDAQLPRRLARRLNALGFDAIHTLDLPQGNRTSDDDVVRRADNDGRIVVTKDADFVTSVVLSGQPRRLLLVSTGNIDNLTLESLLAQHLPALSDAFASAGFVELTRQGLVIHG